ncbi:zinc metalloproteinase nas-14 [Hyalella azteca]|uniref:Metalloendopeptidase n=1 Tax=Hyalella azteca TaxID=294128 RepID=A0A8B7PKE9_HYAAZ|nr:zinc metalloproteinase nas-14 [Hyalella azteca]
MTSVLQPNTILRLSSLIVQYLVNFICFNYFVLANSSIITSFSIEFPNSDPVPPSSTKDIGPVRPRSTFGDPSVYPQDGAGGPQLAPHKRPRSRRSVAAEEEETSLQALFSSDDLNALQPAVWSRLNEIVDFGPEPWSGGLWPDGRVPYLFSKEFDYLPVERLLIKWTMKNIEAKSCVKFVKRTSEADYIKIIYDSYQCYSSVGRVGGEQPLSLGLFCSLAWDRGNIYHELLHALGFYHEHTRPDRDEFVDIKWDNIKPGKEKNFRKDERWAHKLLQMPYDVGELSRWSELAC